MPALCHYAIEEAVLDWGLNPEPPELDASTLPLGYGGGVLDWGLNPGPPALDASTLPLGYRVVVDMMVYR